MHEHIDTLGMFDNRLAITRMYARTSALLYGSYMAKITDAQRAACAEAEKTYLPDPNVVSVGIGFKYKSGERTDEVCIVIGVQKKLPRNEVPRAQRVAEEIAGVRTDVIEYGELRAQADILDATTQALTRKRRPCPPGFSIGHADVTAGTLGAWAHRGESDAYFILSNNHVLASSNDAEIGDAIRQPGPADGGAEGDGVARLTAFVGIHFGTETNKVDAAIAEALSAELVELEIPAIGRICGLRDFELGDHVRKTGRTTETTEGLVETVSATSRINYGPEKGLATFSDQFVVRAEGGSGDFSQGGDSGSVLVADDGFVGGLLFAGGSGVTIANPISHVVSALNIRH